MARCGSEDARATDTTVLPLALTKNVCGTSVTDCVCVLERERACVSVLRAGEAVELSLRLTSHPDGTQELTLRSTVDSCSLKHIHLGILSSVAPSIPFICISRPQLDGGRRVSF